MRHHRLISAGLALLLLAGCAAGSDDSGPAPREVDSAGDYEVGADDAPDAGPQPEEQDQQDQQDPQDQPGEAGREIITTAEVWIEVEEATEAANDVVALVQEAQGRIDERSVYRPAGGADRSRGAEPASAHLTVRVPAAGLEAFLEDLDGVGAITTLDQRAVDVTRTGSDLDARISALETSVGRLQEILAEAQDVSDLIELERELSNRQGELDALRTQRSALSDQVAMSTVYVTLSAEPAPEIDAGGFAGGVQSGWRALLTAVSAVLVATGFLLPWLVVAAALGVPVLLLTRRRRARRTSAAQPESATSEHLDRSP